MGCDIHVYVARRTHDKNGYHFEAAPLYRKTHLFKGETGDPFLLEEIDVGRSYTLFGILAGVRGSSCEPIAEARGLDNVCPPEIRAEYDKLIDDPMSCHDASWYDMSEIRCALSDKKRYPKWYTYLDEDENGKTVKVKDKSEPGPHQVLKDFYDAVMWFANQAWYYAEPDDIRIYFWFDS